MKFNMVVKKIDLHILSQNQEKLPTWIEAALFIQLIKKAREKKETKRRKRLEYI